MIKVYLCGKYVSTEGCGKAKKIILDSISEPTEVFEIREDMVDVMISQGVSKIQEIQSETGFRVNVGFSNSAVLVYGMTKVYLWGDKKECAVAKNIILDLLSDIQIVGIRNYALLRNMYCSYCYTYHDRCHDMHNSSYCYTYHDMYNSSCYCYEPTSRNPGTSKNTANG